MRLEALAEQDRALQLAAIAYGAAVLLHIDRLPLWCSATALLALLWRAAVAWQWPRGLRPALPGRMLRLLLVIGLFALTLAAFRTVNGIAAGSALLAGMGAAKLLETRSRRDGFFVAAVALFLLTSACLDRQSLGRMPAYVLTLWLACAALAALGGQHEGRDIRKALRTAARSLLWAVPFAAVVFLLFPRIPGPLWGMGAGSAATSGLGEEMTPGSISELSLSDAIVFRAQIAGPLPASEQRYWRGPVLHHFDGSTWRRLPGQVAITQAIDQRALPVTQQITLEPTGMRWWFALDTAGDSPAPQVQLTFDKQLISARPVSDVTNYEVTSWLQTRQEGSLSIVAQRMDLRLPPQRNPRSLALAQQLRSQSSSDSDYVQRTLQWLRSGGFTYTLSPPLLGADAVDELLFNTREGFCGHYASAFTSLMRAGGVPARVVTGYQGGEWNPIGGYLLLRQSDAHAWSEVWIEGQGWTRIDPTAVVAPERLQRSLRDLLPASASMGVRLARSNWLAPLLQRWDAAGHWWQHSVVGFDWRTQQSVLESLGLNAGDLLQQLLWLCAAAALWWLLMWALPWLRQRHRQRPLPLAQDWAQLRQQLQRCGVQHSAQLGPLQLAQAGAELFPDLASQLHDSAQRYAALRYGPTVNHADGRSAAALRTQIKQLLRQLRARQRLLQLTPLPPDALQQLCSQLPLAQRMPVALRLRASALARQLLQRVQFLGCNGLQVTESMRELVAFQAALLVLHRGTGLYRSLHSVLLYPDEFVVQQRDEDESGVVTESEQVLSGQTLDTDCIVLSWADVEQACNHDGDYNVVLHEFAHLIDHAVNGELSQRDGQRNASWHDVMEAEYLLLCKRVDAEQASLIDPYGSEAPAEFFAVCTETFFGRPTELRQQHPQLYAVLADFYGLSPADWDNGSRTR